MRIYSLKSNDGVIDCGDVEPFYSDENKWWVAKDFHVAANPGDYVLVVTDPPEPAPEPPAE